MVKTARRDQTERTAQAQALPRAHPCLGTHWVPPVDVNGSRVLSSLKSGAGKSWESRAFQAQGCRVGKGGGPTQQLSDVARVPMPWWWRGTPAARPTRVTWRAICPKYLERCLYWKSRWARKIFVAEERSGKLSCLSPLKSQPIVPRNTQQSEGCARATASGVLPPHLTALMGFSLLC